MDKIILKEKDVYVNIARLSELLCFRLAKFNLSFTYNMNLSVNFKFNNKDIDVNANSYNELNYKIGYLLNYYSLVDNIHDFKEMINDLNNN
jgi:hypothetical protein